MQRYSNIRGSLGKPCFSGSSIQDGQIKSDDSHRHSEEVEKLSGSQGVLSVISALVAGFSFAGLTSVSKEEYESVHVVLRYTFPVINSLTICLYFFVCVICAILEQEGRIASALAGGKTGEEVEIFEGKIRDWYKTPVFAKFRTRLLWSFIFGVPFFTTSVGLLCVLKMPVGPGSVCCSIFIFLGFATLRALLWINKIFREGVLGMGGAVSFRAPSLGMEDKPVLSVEERVNTE